MGPAGWRKNYLRYKTYFLNVVAHYQKRTDLKIYMELFLSLATISIFALFALKPTLTTIAELVKETESKKETISTLDQKIESLARAQATYEQEKEKILLLETSIPKEPTPERFVRQIEALSNRDTVIVLSISLGKTTILGQEQPEKTDSQLEPLPGGAEELSFGINATNTYPILNTFLADMQRMRRPVKIDSLNFKLTETEEGTILMLVVNGRTPYLRDSRPMASR
jgi:hypothetical protein